MRETWRWFGPDDPVSLDNARQAGAQGIVTALHHIYDGRAWSDDDVAARRRAVEAAGPDLGRLRVDPGLRRDQAARRRPTGATSTPGRTVSPASPARASRRSATTSCRSSTGRAPTSPIRRRRKVWRCASTCRPSSPTTSSSSSGRAPRRIIPPPRSPRRGRAAPRSTTRPSRRSKGTSSAACRRARPNTRAQGFAEALRPYAGLTPADLRANLVAFVAEVAPVAEALGARLAIHPDDPPFSLFGLPRVVSTAADYRALFAAVPTLANGMTLVRRLARLARRQRPRRDGARIRAARPFRPFAQCRARGRRIVRRGRASRRRRRHGGAGSGVA